MPSLRQIVGSRSLRSSLTLLTGLVVATLTLPAVALGATPIAGLSSEDFAPRNGAPRRRFPDGWGSAWSCAPIVGEHQERNARHDRPYNDTATE